uniref:U4/U6.U5 small nuclear ribonucleoprotein 27 kDa protein n=1 Tax=Lates calcarifer TaxID=8187 RepID=A0A4W6EB95_LATCA
MQLQILYLIRCFTAATFDLLGRWAGAGAELRKDERDDVLAQRHGSVSEGEGRGIVPVLEIETETGAEVAHDLLTGGVQAICVFPLHRSPARRHRSSSLSPMRQKDRRDDERKDVKEKAAKPIQISAEDMQGKTEEEIEMMKLMGFGNFDSTKGKKTDGSVNAYAVNVTMKRKYRQYMNRKGGFNRPLDFIA